MTREMTPATIQAQKKQAPAKGGAGGQIQEKRDKTVQLWCLIPVKCEKEQEEAS